MPVFVKGFKGKSVPVGGHATKAIRNYLHGGRPFLVKDGTGGELFSVFVGGPFPEK